MVAVFENKLGIYPPIIMAAGGIGQATPIELD